MWYSTPGIETSHASGLPGSQSVMRTHSRAGVNTHVRMYIHIHELALRRFERAPWKIKVTRARYFIANVWAAAKSSKCGGPRGFASGSERSEKEQKHDRGSRLRGDIFSRDASRSNVALVSDLSYDHLLRETCCVFLSHLKLMHKIIYLQLILFNINLFYSICFIL